MTSVPCWFKPVAPVAEEPAALAETEQAAHKAEQIALLFNPAPVKPTDLVVLAVGVVVALLGVADLVAHQEHGPAL